MRPLLSRIVTFGLVATVAQANVLVVTNTSASALQNAIDAAADGDMLLVQPGFYSTCDVDGKALVVISDSPGAAIVQRITARNTTAAQPCTFLGLVVQAPSSLGPAQRAVEIASCAGSVRLQSVRSSAFAPNSTPGLLVTDSPDVALERCVVTGSSGSSTSGSPFFALYPGAGLECANSRVAIYDSELTGGDGNDSVVFFGQVPPYVFPATAGAPGARVDATSTLFVSGSTLRGGPGGNGFNGYCNPQTAQPVAGGAGSNGGDGLVVLTGATATTLGVQLLPGSGGTGGTSPNCGVPIPPAGAPGLAGAPSTGPVATIADTPLALTALTHVRAGNPIAGTATGAPGSLVLLAVSPQTRWVFDPLYEGVFLFGPSARRAVLGVIPGSGVLPFSISSGSLPGGVLAQQRVLQLVARHPSNQVELGGAAFVTILDPSF
ncbi:MAG: hypothetical protein IPJ77_10630 [Planctomycetes bacterium]|nr:hypothetical protein [Planctomycetota bacterium]